MSGKIEDQISAFTDDELSAEECEFLVRRLERDPESREKVLRYAAIGSAIRGDMLSPDPDILRNRLHQTLEGVSLVPAARTEAPGWAVRMLRPLLGAGIAAAAAVVGLLALYNPAQVGLGDVAPTLGAQQITTPGSQAASYVVPQETPITLGVVEPIIQPPARLTNYLVRHGQYAIGIGRTSIHSNVISGQDTQIAVNPEPVVE